MRRYHLNSWNLVNGRGVTAVVVAPNARAAADRWNTLPAWLYREAIADDCTDLAGLAWDESQADIVLA